MAARSNYEYAMDNFCNTEFGVPKGDQCRMELRNAYKW